MSLEIAKLRRILDASDYGRLIGGRRTLFAITGGHSSRAALSVWRRARRDSAAAKGLLLLFFFAREIERHLAISILGPDVVEGLISDGILVFPGARCRSLYALMTIGRHYLFVPHLLQPWTGTSLYFGRDSLRLVREVEHAPPLPVIEVGAGSGIAGLRSRRAYTGYEISEEACRIARVNFALNEVEDRCAVVQSDVPEPWPAGDVHFVCNPPYVPTPPGVDLPPFAGGGEDGLGLVRRCLSAGAAERATCTTLVIRTYGTATTTPIEALLRPYGEQMTVSIVYESRRRVEAADFAALSLAAGGKAAGLFANHFARRRMTHQFETVVRLARGAPRYHVVRAFR